MLRLLGERELLRLYINELKKLKRQKIVRIIVAIGIIMPAVFTVMCIKDDLPYRSLVAMLVDIGNFLIMPCLFYILFAQLIQIEKQNDTLKNIFVIDTNKSGLLLAKLLVSMTFVFIFVFISWLYSLIGGVFLREFGMFGKALISLTVSCFMAIAASMPIIIIIILCDKTYLLTMVLVNSISIIDFILVWQLDMSEIVLKQQLPILLAYRITYPLQILQYSSNLQWGLDVLYYPLNKGLLIILLTCIISLLISM